MKNSPSPIFVQITVLCLFACLMTSFVLYRIDFFEPTPTESELVEDEEYEYVIETDSSKPIMSGSKSGVVPKKTKVKKVKKTPKNKKQPIMSGSKSGAIIPSSKSGAILDSDDIIPSSKSGHIFRPEKIVVDSSDKPSPN